MSCIKRYNAIFHSLYCYLLISLFVSICLQPVLYRNACVLMTIIWRFKCHWIYWQQTIVKHWESIKLILVLFYRVLATLVYVQNTGIVKGEERLYKIQTLRTYRSEVNILAKLLFVLFFLFLHIVLLLSNMTRYSN